jgi:oligo-1,6-glucosidase
MLMVTTEHAVDVTHEELGSLNMLIHFEHVTLDQDRSNTLGKWQPRPLRLTELKQVMTRWQKDLEDKGWNSFYLSNHDQPRSVSRFGDDGRYRVESAKLLATFLHTLHGTPYIYQGEEIGMTNVHFPAIEDYRDIETLNFYREAVEERGLASAQALAAIHIRSRDNARTPVQWNDNTNAGFSTGTPWIKVNSNYSEINVQRARTDPNSIFHYYRKLIQLRREHPIIVYGSYDLLCEAHEQIYAYTRTLKNERLLVMLNFSADMPVFALPTHIHFSGQELLISNYPVDPEEEIRLLTLRPYEARVYRLL